MGSRPGGRTESSWTRDPARAAPSIHRSIDPDPFPAKVTEAVGTKGCGPGKKKKRKDVPNIDV